MLAETLSGSGMAGSLVGLVVAMERNSRQRRVEGVSDAVERLTGKPPTSLADFLISHRLVLLLACKNSQ